MLRVLCHALKVIAVVTALTLLFGQAALAAETEPTVAEHDTGDWSGDRDWWDHDDDDDNEWGDNERGDWSDLVGFAANNGDGGGFWVLTKRGEIYALRGAPDIGAPKADRRFVGMASHPSRTGFWVLDSKGGVHAFGGATKHGSAHMDHAVGIAVQRSGRGYWIASAHGRVAKFGTAQRFGDLRRFDVRVDRIVTTEDADGYYLHTKDDRWISFPNDWWRPHRDRPRRDRDRPTRDHDRPERRQRKPAPEEPKDPPKVTNPRTSGGVRVVTVGGITVARSIADNLRKLLRKATRDGVSLGGWGYRSRARQIELRRAHCGTSKYAIYKMPSSQCSPPTARPGSSMHEVGLAIDFYKRGRDGRAISIGGTREFRWLKGNAAHFGLYNLPSEPWHWSTNGH